jgi:epoxyqueuosine reductase
LLELEQRICDEFGANCVSTEFQHLFVDSAPVLERRWAERAGLGWIGKHTQLINSQLGSYFFIGVLMLNVEMHYDVPIKPKCGTCTRCIDACPTNALKDGTLDARKCISYLTIESKDEIPIEYRSKLSNCVVGCDICADVCPWNIKKAHHGGHPEFNPSTEWLQWNYEDWYTLTEEKFNTVFRKSAIKRAGYTHIMQTLRSLKS